jgi:MFS family permease
MHSPEKSIPPSVIWALGLTQIVGYGTLYYGFAILAPAIGEEFALPKQWVFGALSVALFLGSLLAPIAGRLADSYGAGRIMTYGSLAAALALVACAAAPERFSFAASLIAMELASCFVLYATAFVAIVQIGSIGAQRSITRLTLIAGFASTLFWPLTSALHEHLSWREVASGHRNSAPTSAHGAAPHCTRTGWRSGRNCDPIRTRTSGEPVYQYGLW